MTGDFKVIFGLIGLVCVIQIAGLLLIHADLEGENPVDPMCICNSILLSFMVMFGLFIFAAIIVKKSRWGRRSFVVLLLLLAFDIAMVAGFIREVMEPLSPALYMSFTMIGIAVLAKLPLGRAVRGELGRTVGIALFLAYMLANLAGTVDIIFSLVFLIIGFSVWYSGQEMGPVHRMDHLSSLSSGIILGITASHWMVFEKGSASLPAGILVVLGTAAGAVLLIIGWKYGWRNTGRGWMRGGLAGFGITFLLAGILLMLRNSPPVGIGLTIIGLALTFGGGYLNRKNDGWGWLAFAMGALMILLALALVGDLPGMF